MKQKTLSEKDYYIMKLNRETMTILKNFANISNHVLIRPGNIIRTCSPSNSVIAKATVSDEFQKQISLSELGKFINVINSFETPEIKLSDQYLTVQQDQSKVRLVYTDPEALIYPPDKDLPLFDEYIQCSISTEHLAAIDKIGKILDLSEVVFEGDGSKIQLKAVDASETTKDEYSIDINETDKTFRAVLKSGDLKFLSLDYDVTLSSKGIAHFKAKNFPIEYWAVILVKGSNFDE